MNDLDRLTEELEAFAKHYTKETRAMLEQAALAAQQKAEEELEEEHKRAQKCLDDADNMLEAQSKAMQEEIETLREQLEEARGELDEALEDVNQNVNWRRDTVRERDRLKAALEKMVSALDLYGHNGSLATPQMPTPSEIREIGCQALTPQEDSSAWKEWDNSQQEFLDRQVKVQQEVCEECGGSGRINEDDGYEMDGYPCPSCQPQTPGDVICGSRNIDKSCCGSDSAESESQTPGDVIMGDGEKPNG